MFEIIQDGVEGGRKGGGGVEFAFFALTYRKVLLNRSYVMAPTKHWCMIINVSKSDVYVAQSRI